MGRRSRAGVTLLVAVLLSASTGAQVALADTYTVQLEAGLTVSGTVRDAHGDPVAGADVGVCTAVDQCFVSSGISGADGGYAVRGLDAGTYYVQALPADGANELSSWYDGTPSGSHDPTAAVAIDVADDVSGIDLALPDGLRITGVVKDPEGHPVAGVTVGADGWSVPSDAAGAFAIVGLLPGSFDLGVYTPDTGEYPSGWYADGTVKESQDQATPVEVVDTDITGVEITLVRGRTISGHVTRPAGAPVEVSAIDASTRYLFEVDASGNFTVRGLYPGSYHLLFAVPETSGEFPRDDQFPYGIYNGNGKLLADQNAAGVAIDVTAGNVTGLSAVVPTLPSLQGTVRDAFGPVADAGIRFCDPDAGCGSVHTKADGSFRALNVPAGSYTIQAGAAGHVMAAYSGGRTIPDPLAGTPVSVGTKSVSVAIVLPVGGTLAGKVKGAGGVPLEGVDMSASPAEGGIWEYGPGGTATDASGAFTLRGLADGDYRIAASPPWNSPYHRGYWAEGGTTRDFGAATVIHLDDVTPPVVAPPKAAFGAGDQLGTTTVPVRVGWTATDPGSGLMSFRVQQSTNAGAWSTVASPLLAAATRSLTPSSTTTYRFRVRGADFSDNSSGDVPGAAFRLLRTQQSAGAVTYKGTWSTTKVSSASGGSYRWSKATSASATFAFTGRAVAWVAPRGSGFGKAKVYLDGKLMATVDLAGTASARRIAYAWSGPTSAAHKLRIVNLGTAGRPRIAVDAFVVIR